MIPEAANCVPETDMDEMVTAELPEEVSVMVFVAVCPTLTDPNATVEELMVRAYV